METFLSLLVERSCETRDFCQTAYKELSSKLKKAKRKEQGLKRNEVNKIYLFQEAMSPHSTPAPCPPATFFPPVSGSMLLVIDR